MNNYCQNGHEVEAWCWDGWELERPGIPRFVQLSCLFKPDDHEPGRNKLLVKTRDGNRMASKGDYLVKEPVNDWAMIYKPYMFRVTHKPLESAKTGEPDGSKAN